MWELIVAIEGTSKVTRLDVHGNRDMGDEGLEAITDALSSKTLCCLQYLNLSEVGVTTEGVREMVEVMEMMDRTCSLGSSRGIGKKGEKSSDLEIVLERNELVVGVKDFAERIDQLKNRRVVMRFSSDVVEGEMKVEEDDEGFGL